MSQPEVDTNKVLIERVGTTLVLTINRPEARNSVDHDVSFLIATALQDVESDPDVRCIVLTGAGDKAFSAGLDLKALSRGERVLPKGMEHLSLAGWCNNFTSKPTIAAVNGPALGGGTELALAADLVVAEEGATFGLPEVKRGLIAGAGGVFRLPQVLPQKVALELILTGEPMSAADAHKWGLVNRLVPTGQARTAALELADRIGKNAPLAVQASKRLAYRVVDGTLPSEQASWEAVTAEAGKLWQSDDAKEGPRAFAEKREPVWTGR